MNDNDPFCKLQVAFAQLLHCAPREIVFEVGPKLRVLQRHAGGVEELEVIDPDAGPRPSTTLGCFASALARRAELEIFNAGYDIIAAEKALSAGQTRLKTAEELRDRLIALATEADPPDATR